VNIYLFRHDKYFNPLMIKNIILFKGLNLLRSFFRHYIFIAGLLAGHVFASQVASSGNTATDSGDVPSAEFKKWNPIVTGSFSAGLPGAGQFYTGHYIKSFSFVALEAITLSYARFWYLTSKERMRNAEFYEGMIHGVDSLFNREKAALLRFDVVSARYTMYNALSWMVGGYIYNVLDAVGCARYFVSDEERSPAKAAWLAAIPGLGLGQLYNGSPSKAGMVLMTQVSLGVKVANEHRLMRLAEQGITALEALDDSASTMVASEYKQDWESRRGNSFRNRNSFLWYSLFFYVYGILDAVVDAHLHDYPKKMRAYPDLLARQGAAGIKFEYMF
jgi:TM2 domain-containing membrane protein YozV